MADATTTIDVRPRRRGSRQGVTTVTATQLAEHLGLTRQRIAALADENVIARLPDSRFNEKCRALIPKVEMDQTIDAVAGIVNIHLGGLAARCTQLLRCELAAVGYRQIALHQLTGDAAYLAVFSPPNEANRKLPRDIVPCNVANR